jgi:caspase domain-containing protein
MDRNRKALVVGIDHYESLSTLHGCVNDANAVAAILANDDDAEANKNFDVTVLTSTGADKPITVRQLRREVVKLFQDDNEIALLYFAGHGHAESTGGYLCASDSETGNDGLALSEVLTLANLSKARNRVIVLDSCHSGAAGQNALTPQSSELTEGLTIFTASTKEQYANEEHGHGVFTALFVDALQGAAANLVGDITPGSIYAHIDQSLGSWQQRPVFKTNVKTFVSLRRVQPPFTLPELRKIAQLFKSPGAEYALNPSYEPVRETPRGLVEPDPANTETFALLQKFNRVNLVVPVGAKHMWNAAIESKSCRLTPLGEHYRRLVVDKRLG